MENTIKKEVPTISKADFHTQAVTNGLTRPKLASHYGIKESQVTKIAKQLDITLKRNLTPTINLID